MANLSEGSVWVDGIYRLETSDPVLGGEDGISNLQAKQLGSRSRWLRQQILNLQNNGFTGRRVSRNNLIHGVLPTSVRNCVMSGSADSNGAPNYITYTPNSKLIQINGSPLPVRFSFAAGYDDLGQIDYPGRIATDQTFNINTGLGMPNNSTEVTIMAEHTPNNDGGTTTIIAIETSKIYLSPNPPSQSGGLWFNPNLQIWLRWSPDFGGGYILPAFVVPLARCIRNSNGDIVAMLVNSYRTGIEGTPSVPAGTVIYSAASHETPPAGYLHCNGATLQSNIFTELFGVIGTTFGSPQSGLFNLPDLRGEFIRGADASRGVDIGRVLGSSQAALVGSHKHQVPLSLATNGEIRMTDSAPAFGLGDSYNSLRRNTGGDSGASTANYILTDTPYSSTNQGAGDNRPRNVALNAFIRYI